MPYTCIIIDDEPDAVEILTDYIQQMPELELVDSYVDPVLAMNEIAQGSGVDFIFMDIDMPRISGIDLSKAIREKTEKLIFTTAHTKYAFDAFQVEADAYLLKPFTFAKFALTINKLVKNDLGQTKKTVGSVGDFYIKTTEERNRFIRVDVRNIIAVEGFKNYIKIFTTADEIITYLTLKEVKEKLNETANFIQIHRSFVISTNHIEKVEGSLIKLSNDMLIPIGTFYRDAFFEYITKHTIKTGRINN